MEASSAQDKKNLVQNSFFIWSHILILLLISIPLISKLLSATFHISEWILPKIYELKLYALAMLGCLIIPYLKSYAPKLLLEEHQNYNKFILLFYPVSVFLYSLSMPEYLRYGGIFILCLVGLGVLFYDRIFPNGKYGFLKKYYNQSLIFSISLTVLLIISHSDANTFHLFSLLSLIVAVCVFLGLRFLNLESPFFSVAVIVFLGIVIFGSMLGAMEVTHYSFFLGPIIEILYGHLHPLSIDIQYGGGLSFFSNIIF